MLHIEIWINPLVHLLAAVFEPVSKSRISVLVFIRTPSYSGTIVVIGLSSGRFSLGYLTAT